jgi:anti-anti-sigma regulatory factor
MSDHSKLCAPTGDLTIFEAAAFKESLIKLLSYEGLVCLDLAGVKRIDTAAIQLMWAARKSGRLLVTHISDDLSRKLKDLGFTEPLSE